VYNPEFSPVKSHNHFLGETAMPPMPRLTQEGIAEKLGKSRQHVASELRKLKAERQVEFEVTHAPMARTKRKAFYLTQKGITRAMQLRERAETERGCAALG
jgi:DNA-binding transcriptional regulator LsrR (DeoR family)